MENDPSVITTKVTERERELNDLYTRMDEDFDEWDLETSLTPTGVKKARNKRDTDIDIVSNNPRTYADNVQSILSSADFQIMVRMAEAEGEDKRGDIGKLERLFYFALEKADERLGRLLLPPLRDQLIWYGDIRGWRAVRVLVYKLGKDVIFDIVPLDPRWLTYVVGDRGLLWVGYTSFRSKASLKDEYNYKDAPKKNNNPVIDWWESDKEKGIFNSVVCNNKFLKDPNHEDVPSMPFSIRPISTRPPISGLTESKIKGYGESIFAPNREITKMVNELASVWAGHANILAKQPQTNYYDEQGIQLKDTTYLAESVLNLPMNHNKLESPTMKEISPTLVNLVAWLDAQRERGSLPDIPVGSPPPSGTLYNLVQEAGNKIFNPQVRNLNDVYGDICRLIEEQLLVGKLKVKVETMVKDKYFATPVAPVDLKRPHIIKVEFTARTPWTQLDTAQVAQMLKALGLPDSWIWENILKVQDPKGLADLAAIELFEHSPKGAMKRAVEALIETRGDIAAALSLVRDMDRMEAQEAGQVPEGQTPPVSPAGAPPAPPPMGGGI